MQASVTRRSVDLSAYPDLVVVILGFRVRRLRKIAALLGSGKALRTIQANPHEELLSSEQFSSPSITSVSARLARPRKP